MRGEDIPELVARLEVESAAAPRSAAVLPALSKRAAAEVWQASGAVMHSWPRHATRAAAGRAAAKAAEQAWLADRSDEVGAAPGLVRRRWAERLVPLAAAEDFTPRQLRVYSVIAYAERMGIGELAGSH